MVTTTDLLPNVGISTGGVLTVIMWVIIFVVIAGLTAFITYMIIMNKRFKFRVRVWKSVNGQPYEISPVEGIKAMEKVIPGTRESVLYLRKPKRLLPLPTIQSGNNMFYYFIKADGHWFNIGIGDLNAEAKRLKIHFDHADMRYARDEMLKHFSAEYSNESWWSKNAGWVMYMGLVMMTGIMIYINFKQFHDTAGILNSSLVTQNNVIEKLNQVLGNLDRICTGGSSITVPA